MNHYDEITEYASQRVKEIRENVKRGRTIKIDISEGMEGVPIISYYVEEIALPPDFKKEKE